MSHEAESLTNKAEARWSLGYFFAPSGIGELAVSGTIADAAHFRLHDDAPYLSILRASAPRLGGLRDLAVATLPGATPAFFRPHFDRARSSGEARALLWLAFDVIELAVRYAASLSLGIARQLRAADEASFEAARLAVISRLNRPSFGDWFAILNQLHILNTRLDATYASGAMVALNTDILALQFAKRSFLRAPPTIVRLRNTLAHTATLNDEVVAGYLDDWGEAIDVFVATSLDSLVRQPLFLPVHNPSQTQLDLLLRSGILPGRDGPERDGRLYTFIDRRRVILHPLFRLAFSMPNNRPVTAIAVEALTALNGSVADFHSVITGSFSVDREELSGADAAIFRPPPTEPLGQVLSPSSALTGPGAALGREELIESGAQWLLKDHPARLILTGAIGIGKSTVAAGLFDKLQDVGLQYRWFFDARREMDDHLHLVRGLIAVVEKRVGNKLGAMLDAGQIIGSVVETLASGSGVVIVDHVGEASPFLRRIVGLIAGLANIGLILVANDESEAEQALKSTIDKFTVVEVPQLAADDVRALSLRHYYDAIYHRLRISNPLSSTAGLEALAAIEDIEREADGNPTILHALLEQATREHPSGGRPEKSRAESLFEHLIKREKLNDVTLVSTVLLVTLAHIRGGLEISTLVELIGRVLGASALDVAELVDQTLVDKRYLFTVSFSGNDREVKLFNLSFARHVHRTPELQASRRFLQSAVLGIFLDTPQAIPAEILFRLHEIMSPMTGVDVAKLRQIQFAHVDALLLADRTPQLVDTEKTINLFLSALTGGPRTGVGLPLALTTAPQVLGRLRGRSPLQRMNIYRRFTRHVGSVLSTREARGRLRLVGQADDIWKLSSELLLARRQDDSYYVFTPAGRTVNDVELPFAVGGVTLVSSDYALIFNPKGMVALIGLHPIRTLKVIDVYALAQQIIEEEERAVSASQTVPETATNLTSSDPISTYRFATLQGVHWAGNDQALLWLENGAVSLLSVTEPSLLAWWSSEEELAIQDIQMLSPGLFIATGTRPYTAHIVADNLIVAPMFTKSGKLPETMTVYPRCEDGSYVVFFDHSIGYCENVYDTSDRLCAFSEQQLRSQESRNSYEGVDARCGTWLKDGTFVFQAHDNKIGTWKPDTDDTSYTEGDGLEIYSGVHAIGGDSAIFWSRAGQLLAVNGVSRRIIEGSGFFLQKLEVVADEVVTLGADGNLATVDIARSGVDLPVATEHTAQIGDLRIVLRSDSEYLMEIVGRQISFVDGFRLMDLPAELDESLFKSRADHIVLIRDLPTGMLEQVRVTFQSGTSWLLDAGFLELDDSQVPTPMPYLGIDTVEAIFQYRGELGLGVADGTAVWVYDGRWRKLFDYDGAVAMMQQVGRDVIVFGRIDGTFFILRDDKMIDVDYIPKHIFAVVEFGTSLIALFLDGSWQRIELSAPGIENREQ